MDKQFYYLAPVEVVKVSTSNLADVAEWCGGKIASVESRKHKGRMDSYVWVPTPKGTAISWAFPGMFVTKRVVRTVKDDFKVTWAVFRRDYFEKNYFETPGIAEKETWERHDKAYRSLSDAQKGPSEGLEEYKGTLVPEYLFEGVTEAPMASSNPIVEKAMAEIGEITQKAMSDIRREWLG
jgi:hypothetical protein